MTVRARLVIVGGVIVLASACGAKGPPLPPLRPVPAAPTGLTASRIGDRVTLRVTVPEANADPASPLSISAIEIYARTLPMGSEPPSSEQLIRKEYLVATIPVRPPAPVVDDMEPTPTPTPTPTPAAGPDTRPGPGEAAVWTETLPATVDMRPLDLTRAQKARVDSRRPLLLPLPPTGLLAPWFRMPLPTRYYAAIGVSERRRPGPASALTALSFGPAPETPTNLQVTSNETELTVSWTTTTQAVMKVIETNSSGVEQPMPVQETPITSGSWSTPVAFGVERCFVVRNVVRRGQAYTESATVGPKCWTPKDTYGPPAPTGLVPVSGPTAVTLVWDAVSVPDLAGYIVLRITGASETAQELTPTPITALQFEDTTAQAGQRYVYHVVAVDTAGNRGPRSAGQTVVRLPFSGK